MVFAVRYLGGAFMLFCRAVFLAGLRPFRFRQILGQMARIGVDSFAITALISFFLGVVLALQSAYQMRMVGALMYIPSLVSVSMTREIGPVLTSLVVAGRVGASIAAEIGSMKVTEQIDALETLATNPVKYLVTPRLIALVTMLPLLTVFADLIGIFGGYVVSTQKLGLSHTLYMRMSFDPLVLKDITTGLWKTFVFGGLIAVIACYEGMNVEGGAEGVGGATTRAVVLSFIAIIVADAVFTILFYFAS